MKIIIATLGLVLFGGCGSNDAPESTGKKDASPVVSIEGTWIDELNADLVIRAKFDATNFELDGLYLLTDGTYGMQIDQGTYSLSGSNINSRLKSSSCQGVKSITNPAQTWTFERQGDSLNLNTGKAYLAFQLRTSPPTGMGGATIGCVKDDGSFIDHATSPVP